MRFFQFILKIRPGLSGRDAFNCHVEWFFFIVAAIFVLVLVRAGMLQLTDSHKGQLTNTKEHLQRTDLLSPARGQIYDRNGHLLATSLMFQSVVMDPFKVRAVSDKRRGRAFKMLSQVLSVSIHSLTDLSKRRVSMVLVKRAISSGTASKIKSGIRKGKMPGIAIIVEQEREYPLGEATAAIIGVVRGSRDILLNFRNTHANASPRALRKHFPWFSYADIPGATPQRGVGGIEQVFNPVLAGAPDIYVRQLDRNQNWMPGFTRQVAKGKGPDAIILSIEGDLQRFVARAIQKKLIENQARLGMVLAMEAFSGEIFAAYSASTDRGHMIPSDSHVFTSSFEPGSVAKPITMILAFEMGVLSERDRFDCNQPAKVGNKIYRDESRYKHDLSPEEIIALSSDSGMAQIVKRLVSVAGNKLSLATTDFLKRCGLGDRCSIGHTALPRSTLPPPREWSAITPSQMAIGYELKVSPIHLARIYAAFVNGGRLPSPILVKRLVDKNGTTLKEFGQADRTGQCFASSHASLIHQYLKAVVSHPRGTGRRAAIEGIETAGKTGTARRLVNGKYSRKSHNSTFMGILPIREGCTMIIGVFFQGIKKGSDYGGTACAPVFKEIAEFILEEGLCSGL